MFKFNFFISLMSNNEIKNRIFTLFEYNYNLNDEIRNEYEIGIIDPKKIGLEHIKINESLKERVLDELKLGKFRLNKYKDNIIRLIRYHESFPTLVKISPYKNDKEIGDLSSGPNRDSFFSFLFSEKVLDNKINLVELPIINLDVEYSKLKDIIKGYPEIENFEDLLGEKKISKTVSVRIRERFFKSKSLLEHLETDKCSLKDILFQIALTLGQIQHYYPKFKHNNLDLSQINIYYKRDKGSIKTYNIGNEIYNYESPGFELKIGSFENSSLDPIIKNNSKNKNDLVMLAKNILDSKVFNKIKCDNKSLELIKKISNKNNSMDSVEPISPQKILNSVMDKSLKNSRKIKNDNINSHDYYLGKKSIKVKGKLSKEFGKVDFIDKKLTRKFKGTKKQKGGASFKPSTKNDPNNPRLSNDQRMSHKKYREDQPRPREPAVLAEQKVYQQSQAPAKKQNPLMYPPVFVPTNHPTYNMSVPYQPWNYEINKFPIQNVYNVSLADPRGDHSRLARIYENMTPGKEFGLSSTSLAERDNSSSYISSIMVNQRNGMDLSLTGGEGSLLEHIKLMEIHPYYYDNNPYDTMPDDFLLYTSAYPIRYDSERERIRLAKNSVGLNMRMYSLTIEALRSHAKKGLSGSLDHKPWKELEYYRKIDEIIKERKSPNFVKMHFWVLDRDSRIDYKKIKEIKSKKLILDQKIQQAASVESHFTAIIRDRIKNILVNDAAWELFNRLEIEKFIRNAIQNGSNTDDVKESIMGLLKLEKENEDHKRQVKELIDVLRNETEKTLSEDSKVTLGIITESPTSTFIQWATPTYEGNGSLKKMSQTGFHDYKEYEALLFQYIHAFSILQEKNIGFDNFDPAFNLYVNDIYHDDRDTKHWRYVVDDVEYFVPNYGYVGLIDSYCNIKLNSTPDEIFAYFKKIIDPNFYNGDWRVKHAHKVPKEFLDLLDRLNRLDSQNIKDYLKEFRNLLNNRIGVKVTNNEIGNIDLTRFPSNLKNGTLVAIRDENSYKWAVVLDKTTSEDNIIQKYTVQTDREEKPEENVPSARLFVSNENVEPRNVDGVKYDNFNMIERYK